MNKQKGFMLIGMILVMGFLTLGVMKYSEFQHKKAIQANTNSFYNRVLFIKQQIHAYVTRQYQTGSLINSAALFPSALADLEGDFIASCTTENNIAGHCMRYDQTPWGTIAASDYRRVGVPNNISPEYYRAELDIKLPSKTDTSYEFERNATLSLFAQFPNITYDDTNNLITVRIDRPDKAFAYDGLVKRSGDDSTLLGDWDAGGNFSATNFRDLSLRADDGSQILVSTRLKESYTINHSEWVDIPKCVVGQTPYYQHSVASFDVPIDTHTIIGGTKTFLIGTSPTQWQFGITTQTKRNSDGQQEVLNSGRISVLTGCR
ncbi:type II secretion system protein [Vibrio maritimus]|uniref:type II secretion system protein n=1 Tax=Vibrio maritimus TaxID=990268 RepID=UPI001F30AFF7|nr:type II secretion system protein [Vibrio maritimus]